jgi:phage terminase large subunit-like protein
MDPVRLDKIVLADFKTNVWTYAGQFLQKPVPPGGGIFKAVYFLKRERAAPYNCKRIRYWDRASTLDGGCATAGVLLARDNEGIFYIEHVVHGHWDPVERNQQMRATAYRDRAKYGKYEPVIWVEREGGASGRDAWLGVVRALQGFTVKEHNVQQMGSKDVRAEPWATQCAAGNVVVIDDDSWDVQGYIEEHVRFRFDPTTKKRFGGLVDRVDASSGAFALLVKTQRPNQALRTIALYGKKNTGRWLAVCTQEDLAMLEIEGNPTLLIFLNDPLPKPTIIQGDKQTLETPAEEVMCNDRPRLDEVQGGSSDIAAGVAEIVSSMDSRLDGSQADQPPPSLTSPTYLGPKLPMNQGVLELSFADIDPADWQDKWHEEVEPWGLTPENLQMNRDHAKKLWSFLLKPYHKPWQVVVLVDKGGEDGRALSMAMGIADQLRIPRSAIYLPGDGEAVSEDEIPPNPYVFDLTKLSRHLVVA